MRYVVGIDEAGRGSLAGPVAVGVVKIGKAFDQTFWQGIKDSKKLSLRAREAWLRKTLEAKRVGKIDFHVSLISEKVIDKKGIVYAVKLGIKRSLDKLKLKPDLTEIFLDGSLKASREFVNQQTIIKGDEKVPIISLASILAKVARDEKMVRLSRKFPKFDFHLHKGYGTLRHRQALQKYGSTVVHRQSFLKH